LEDQALGRGAIRRSGFSLVGRAWTKLDIGSEIVPIG